MNAKEYLSRISGIDRRINSLINRRDEMKTLAERCTISLSAAPGGGGDGRGLENNVQKILLLEQQIDEEIERLIGIKAETLYLISRIDDIRLENLLEMRYVEGKNWTEIHSELDLAETRTSELHHLALKKFQKILDEEGGKARKSEAGTG